jgi:MiaB-like tRNA modifying enzyme
MRVFIKSYGCSTNVADGGVLKGCLAHAGFELVTSVSAADVIILNTCAVKGPTENRMIDAAKRVPRDKKLIVAGCLPLISFERLQKEVMFNGAVGPAKGVGIVEVVKRVSEGERIIEFEGVSDSSPQLILPRIQPSQVVSIVPVSYGCLGSCAYCCVVLARGRLRSCSLREVVQRVREDLTTDLREFWITAQDTACYGMDRGSNLAELLNSLCDIEGSFKIRVGMMTPDNASSILEELLHAFQDEKVFKFLHLPVQSGDDEVLKKMNRPYSIKDFERVTNAFRKKFPDLTLATDVICGFPGESEEAFARTLELLEEARPSIVNVSRFFARPKTAAAEMQKDFLSLSKINERSNRASELARRLSLESNRHWVGWAGEILVDEIGKVPGSWVGRNFAYKPVVVRSVSSPLGKSLRVRVVAAFATYLKGEVIQ